MPGKTASNGRKGEYAALKGGATKSAKDCKVEGGLN